MKIRLQSNSKLQLVKAVKYMLDIGLKEAKCLVDGQVVRVNNKVYVTINSEKTEEQIKAITEGCGVTYIPLSDTDFCEQNCNQTETIKIISDDGAGPLLDAVIKLCQVSLKEASEFIRENIVSDQTHKYVYVDVDMPREKIETIISYIPDIEVQFLDKEQIDNNDADTTVPESANYHEAEQESKMRILLDYANLPHNDSNRCRLVKFVKDLSRIYDFTIVYNRGFVITVDDKHDLGNIKQLVETTFDKDAKYISIAKLDSKWHVTEVVSGMVNLGDVREVKQVSQKSQEITDDDLGVSIHSIDEESIGWQCKMLFTHEQAARVMAGLHDAKFNVTETLVMHDGDKATMLVITKTFPTGTRKKDLEKFEKLIRIFIQTVCAIVSLEDALEGAKERAIEAFNELQDYE